MIGIKIRQNFEINLLIFEKHFLVIEKVRNNVVLIIFMKVSGQKIIEIVEMIRY